MRIFLRKLFTLLITCCISAVSYGQTITIGKIDAGPYGLGSTIAVPISIDDTEGKLTNLNVYRLYLSDADGSFTNQVEIGHYKGFYTTFVNGVLPKDIVAGGNYHVRIQSAAATSVASEMIVIKPEAGVVADLNASTFQILSSDPKTFGTCSGGRDNTRFSFTNASTAGATVTATFNNELKKNNVTNATLTTAPYSFNAMAGHYTITVRAELNGIVGTQSFFLINNIANTAFSTSGDNSVCLPLGVLTFGVETGSSNGIQLNFPGNTYQINWGDGNVENLTISQIKAADSKVRHIYTRSSCGSQVKIGDINYYNVFGIEIKINSPFCASAGTPINTQAKAIQQPENILGAPLTACVNNSLKIFNLSNPGDNPSNTSPVCGNNNVTYNWYVDDELVAQDKSLNYDLIYMFKSKGTHKIRLESISNSLCQAIFTEKTICVQDAPKPKFTFPSNTVCISETLKAKDFSVIDNPCGADVLYHYTVKGSDSTVVVKYANGTTAESRQPEFIFPKPGIYKIKLGITLSCGPVDTEEQTVIVNAKPTIETKWIKNLCGKGQLLTFNADTTGNLVFTSFSGTTKELADTYVWKISGGAFSFKNNTNANSKEPSILFSDFGKYTIIITHTNTCGTETVTKDITFNQSPTVNAGDDQKICFGSPIVLNGSIKGIETPSFKWVGGRGAFLPGRDALNPTYTPSTEEVLAGIVKLTLSVTTDNVAPCDKVEDMVVITLNPENVVKSLASKTICTGSMVNYEPEATIAASTFTWTATGSANAKGFSATGEGTIKDIITNTDKNSNAVVTYTITPINNNCSSDAFTFIVTVNPLPTVVAVIAKNPVCNNQPAAITLTPNISDLKYTWTTTNSGSISGNTSQSVPVSVSIINDILVNTGNTIGSVTYNITPVTSAGCTGETIQVVLTITPSPVQADAGEDQLLCSETSTQLLANNPEVGTGKWTLTSGQTGIKIVNDTAPKTEVTGLKPGEVYHFYWTITSLAGCESTQDETVVNDLLPLANNQLQYDGNKLCSGASVTIIGTVPTGGSSKYTYAWEASLDGTNWMTVNATDKNLLLALTETTFIRRKITSGSCTNVSEPVKVIVLPGISMNTIEKNQLVCAGAPSDLITGSLPSGGNENYSFQWQQSTDNGLTWFNIAFATAKDYQPAVLSNTTSFRRIVTSQLCTGEQKSTSNVAIIAVGKDAIALFTWKDDTGCAPFEINSQIITTSIFDVNDEYSWYVNDNLVGRQVNFPGLYTMNSPGQSVTIRLDVTSKTGCKSATFTHTFKTADKIVSDFTVSNTQGCGPLLVSFKNLSTGTAGASINWDFGNGQTSASFTPADISFLPRNDGKDTVYTIVLRLQSNCGITEKSTKITVFAKPASIFSPSGLAGCSPYKVTFSNTSPGNGNKYHWYFGDGTDTITTDKNKVFHTYRVQSNKVFTVKMVVENDCGNNETAYNIKVTPNNIVPVVLVNGGETEGCAPFNVKFTNNTSGATFYYWDFNDGTPEIPTNKAPETIYHTFTQGGVYMVKLRAINSCTDTTIYQKITVYPKPIIKLEAKITEGCKELPVEFVNLTKNATSYLWSFGDGSISNQPNPVHAYSYKGSPYTVTLIAYSSLGCPDTLIMKNYIKVTPPPVADFAALDSVIAYPYFKFSFKDKSLGSVLSYRWDFGDRSAISTLQNPDHSYPDTGRYKVQLTITTKEGCTQTVAHNVRITGVPGQLFIPNAFMPNSASHELRIFKAKGSGLKEFRMRVFNKWGQEVWTTTKLDSKMSPEEGWDGTINGEPAPQGVYIWEVTATFENGNKWNGMSYNHSEPKRTGSIYLIR